MPTPNTSDQKERLAKRAAQNEPAVQMLSPVTCAKIRAFRDARGWAVYHHPKDLAISISLEAAELLELFQWSGSDAECLEKRERMLEELADIATYAVLLADRLGASLDEAVLEKLEKTEAKYPAESMAAEKGLDRYEELKAKARAEEAEALAAKMSNEDAPDPLAPLKNAMPALVEYARFLKSHPAGAWTSASNDRIYFVQYAPETVRIWAVLDELAKAFTKPVLDGAYPTTLPSYPDAADLAPLEPLSLLSLLIGILREERRRDGAFLSAADAGIFSRIVAALEVKC